jgi:uncharacterized protein (TIGR02466 family)
MTVLSLFPTKLHKASIAASPKALNEELALACRSIRDGDRAGRSWCKKNGYQGYTSYASLDDLTWRAPPFAHLQTLLNAHVARFAHEVGFDLGPRKLALDSMWINILEPGGVHSGHIHPNAVISGTYYVSVPKGSGALKIEDPRLPMLMAAPPKKVRIPAGERAFAYFAPKAGDVLLWESWLRHEVVAGTNKSPRISISFNYA